MATSHSMQRIAIFILLIAAIAGGWWLMQYFQQPDLTEGFASGNGRIEATEVDIASKLPGRLIEVSAREGDWVEAGQTLARMDTSQLEAQLREAEAQLKQAEQSKIHAEALVIQRESESRFAAKELKRSQDLVKRALVSQEKADQDLTAKQKADAALKAARVQVQETDSAIEAAIARTERIKADIDDSILKAMVNGRVLYRLAEPGEVLGAGGKVMTLLELTDVYMTIYLPTTQVGRVNLGSEAHILLDAIPDVVIPAKVSFVAPEAQFTPKSVETRTEREKLMFRVKLKIDPELLKAHIEKVKTGLPGVGWVRLDVNAEWPPELRVDPEKLRP